MVHPTDAVHDGACESDRLVRVDERKHQSCNDQGSADYFQRPHPLTIGPGREGHKFFSLLNWSALQVPGVVIFSVLISHLCIDAERKSWGPL